MQRNIFFRLGFSLLLILALSACTEVLDREPKVDFTLENFFQTEDHAILGTNAVYNHLRDWSVHVFSYIGMTDIVSDDADKGSIPSDAFFLQELDDFTFSTSNIAPLGIWNGYYTGVFRANLAIEKIPDIDMDVNLRDRLVAENKFLRAYFYFNLVRWYGDVPLITEPFPEDFSIPRAPAADVYAQIIQDLEDAAATLPATYGAGDVGRATSGAAKGLLAKVYLTLKDFDKVEQLTGEIITSTRYSLYPSYSELFTEAAENSSESLFEVQNAAFEEGGAGSQYNEVQGVRGTPNLGWGFNRPSNDLVAAYETGDPRREATILYVGEVLPDGSDIVQDNPNVIGERYNQKAWVPEHPGGNGNGPGNIRILRYADVLLMAAEALNENDQPSLALGYLNEVRRRARGSNPNVLPDITVTDKTQLRQIIWHERRVELALEQQRWFDLLRQGRAATVMQALGKDFVTGKHELFPIPQQEIDLSAGVLMQNPGY
ncbi:MAG: RagB/SusD family nutrient uptake outer membrane protein [Lewinella sp.]|nr:RagB/SusD family nutrient uptake outer membrane protein [Lewinella sp.]